MRKYFFILCAFVCATLSLYAQDLSVIETRATNELTNMLEAEETNESTLPAITERIDIELEKDEEYENTNYIPVTSEKNLISTSLIISDPRSTNNNVADPFRRSEVMFFISLPFTYVYPWLLAGLLDADEHLLLPNSSFANIDELSAARDIFVWSSCFIWAAMIVRVEIERMSGINNSHALTPYLLYMPKSALSREEFFSVGLSYKFK